MAGEADSFGAALRRYRQRGGLTQEQLAQRSGLSVNAVSALERGSRRRPYPHTVRALAAALALHPDDQATLTRLSRLAAADAGPPPLPMPTPRQLPTAVRDFTGRESDLDQLDQLLPAPFVVISAIGGTAGVGKTALAVTWAHRVREQFPDGQLYVNLRGYDDGPPMAPTEALDGFLRALNVPIDQIPPRVEQRAALFRSLLDGRRMLLLLDNANHPDQVRPLLPGSPSSTVVITSRSRLTGLAVTAGACLIDLDRLPLADAVQLLRAGVGPDRADAEPTALAELARLCARLPLALRLCGQYAAARPQRRLAELAEELRDAGYRLELFSRGCDAATAVRTVFTWSYLGLPRPQARLFRLLGLHPGGEIGLESAAALAGLAVPQVQILLEDLTDAHLIETVTTDRWQLHDLLRAYAREQVAIEDASDADSALIRLIGYYLRTVVAAARLLNPSRLVPFSEPVPGVGLTTRLADYDEALRWCGREHLAMVELVDAATGLGWYRAAWQLTHALGGYYFLRGNWTVWIDVYQRGLTAATRAGDRDGEGHMRNGLAIGLAAVGRWSEAIPLLQQALPLFQELGDRPGEGKTLINLGDTFRRGGHYQAAIDHCGRALSIFQELDNPSLQAVALGTQGEACLALGRPGEAIRIFEDVLGLCRKANDRSGEGVTHAHLGAACLRAGRHQEAADHLAAARRLCEASGDRYGYGMTLRSLGDLYQVTGQHTAARGCWREALEIFEEQGDPRAEELRTVLDASPP